MIEITGHPISPETVINSVRSNECGCVVTYVGLIRDHSKGRSVLSVEYRDPHKEAVARLHTIADEVRKSWEISDIAISHRTGILQVGEINLVIAVASSHRGEGLKACEDAIDRFKRTLPTEKLETYADDNTNAHD